jgi:signal transduction histidine kinase
MVGAVPSSSAAALTGGTRPIPLEVEARVRPTAGEAGRVPAYRVLVGIRPWPLRGTTVRLPSVRGMIVRGPFARWPRAADAVLAVVLFLASLFVSDQPGGDLALRPPGEVPAVDVVLLALAAGALYWRRRRPLAVLGMILIGSVLSLALGHPDLLGFAVIALYSVGRYAGDWSYTAAGGVIALVTASGLVRAEPVGVTAIGIVAALVAWYAGRWIRGRGERVAQLEREQAAEARRVVADERTRIARELHDVVAHRVSMMTVQAGAARTVAEADSERALRAMEAVEQAGREALSELRHLLGVLRPEADVDGLGPQPGVADLPRLIDQFRRAGVEVASNVDEFPRGLPARVDLFTYRIVQEALTNVLKHAGPGARAEVRLGVDARKVVIEVRDDGHGTSTLPGSGHGLVGMRERALLLGGSLDAGRHPDGGFRVIASLPLGSETT